MNEEVKGIHQLPVELICLIAGYLRKADILRFSATSRRFEQILAYVTWDNVYIKLRHPTVRELQRTGMGDHELYKVVDELGVEKLCAIIQDENVQNSMRQLLISVDRASFEHAQHRHKHSGIRSSSSSHTKPSHLEQLVTHMIPAFCRKLQTVKLYVGQEVEEIPDQIGRMVQRLSSTVEISYVMDAQIQKAGRRLVSKLRRRSSLMHNEPNMSSKLSLDCPKLEAKSIVKLTKNYEAVKTMRIVAPHFGVDNLEWAPPSLEHLHIETISEISINKYRQVTLPNLLSIHVSGKWPCFDNISTPLISTVWVNQVTNDVAQFIVQRRVKDLIVNSDLSMPGWVASDPANLCTSVRTFLLYNTSFDYILLGFLKLLPEVRTVLCYMSETFKPSEEVFIDALEQQLSNRPGIRAVYLCDPLRRRGKTHTTDKRIVFLTPKQFFARILHSSLDSFCNSII